MDGAQGPQVILLSFIADLERGRLDGKAEVYERRRERGRRAVFHDILAVIDSRNREVDVEN